MKECLTSHIPTQENFADLLTKVLSGAKRQRLVRGILHYIYDDYDQEMCAIFGNLELPLAVSARMQYKLEGTVKICPKSTLLLGPAGQVRNKTGFRNRKMCQFMLKEGV